MDNMYDRLSVTSSVYQKVLIIGNGGITRRFHTIDTIKDRSVAAHSFYVAQLCWLLTGSGQLTVHLLMAALNHDLAEQVYGDIPAPTKRLLGYDKQMETKLEEDFLDKNDLGWTLDEGDKRILKIADKLAGMIECCQERALGNRFAEAPFRRFSEYADELIDITSYNEVETKEAIERMWRDATGCSKS